jgi:hypothetical protein
MKERQMIYWLHLLVMWIISISCNSSNYVFKNHTIEFNAPFNPLDYSTCSYPEVVLAFLLYEGSTNNANDQFVCCVYFTFSTSLLIHPHRQKSDLFAPNSNSSSLTTIENWTYVYMNLFTWNIPYYYLL